MEIKWLSHSGFLLKIGDKKIVIDPWIKNNPLSKCKIDDMKNIDLVLVTHDHMDHLGDSIEIANKNRCKLIGIYELSKYLKEKGVEQTIGMNIGGTVKIDDLEIIMVQAFHSSHLGVPVGYVIRRKTESAYHAGDTGVFYDMKLIGELYEPKVVFLPIGGHFTMGIMEAIKAVELIKPKIVIPMHYNTFPLIKVDPNNFKDIVYKKMPEIKVIIPEINKWFKV